MLSARDIHTSFDALEVIRGVDIDIPPSEVMGIVGPSGAGKTTLLQILGTLDRPDKGTLTYNATDILSLSPNKLARFRNRNIGFVFQFHQLLPEFTLLENVAMPALIGGAKRSEAFEEATRLLDTLGLSQRLSHRPTQLSGGECQRAAVARALINKPAIVLADEPSGSLDSHNRTELHKLFFSLRDKLGVTFVIVTHDEQLASDCDRVVHMRDGVITDIITRR